MKLATVTILLTALLLAGCDEVDYRLREWTYKNDYNQSAAEREREDYLRNKAAQPSVALRDISSIFNDYNLVLPNGNRIRYCSAYSCTNKQIYRLQADTLQKAKNFLDGAWTARGERNALEKALSFIERVVGPATGTAGDKQGSSSWSNGNTGQMNHTDEALNVTSILMVMFRYEMIRYHDLLAPKYKGGTLYPVIRDRDTGELFGIDAGYRDNGEEIKIFPWRGAAP